MSVASLEKFNKQFEHVPPRSVAQILAAEREGRFSFYIPTSDKLDTATLVDKIEERLGALTEVVQNPYIILKNEYARVRTEQAGAMTPQGIQMTVKDKKSWKIKDGKPRPEYVYAKTREDEYNTYENRMVRTLLDRTVRFLNLPIEYAKDGVKNMYEAYFQHTALNKLDLVKLMDADLFKSSDPRAFTDYKKLFYLRGKLSQLRSSAFYKIMSRYPSFAGRPEATNLFVHNSNYNACLKLWLFLDEFNAGLSSLSQEEQRSIYSAFIALAMIGCYVRMGFRIVKDAVIERINEAFSLHDFVLEDGRFRVILNASAQEIRVLVQCPQILAQQETTIGLHTDIAEEFEGEYNFTVSLHRTDYSDRTACVVPGNKNSLKDLESIVRCTVFTFEAKKEIYSRLCLVCGSNAVNDKDYFYQCDDCGAAYCFPDDDTVWLNRFNVLEEKK